MGRYAVSPGSPLLAVAQRARMMSGGLNIEGWTRQHLPFGRAASGMAAAQAVSEARKVLLAIRGSRGCIRAGKAEPAPEQRRRKACADSACEALALRVGQTGDETPKILIARPAAVRRGRFCGEAQGRPAFY